MFLRRKSGEQQEKPATPQTNKQTNKLTNKTNRNNRGKKSPHPYNNLACCKCEHSGFLMPPECLLSDDYTSQRLLRYASSATRWCIGKLRW